MTITKTNRDQILQTKINDKSSHYAVTPSCGHCCSLPWVDFAHYFIHQTNLLGRFSGMTMEHYPSTTVQTGESIYFTFHYLPPWPGSKPAAFLVIQHLHEAHVQLGPHWHPSVSHSKLQGRQSLPFHFNSRSTKKAALKTRSSSNVQ